MFRTGVAIIDAEHAFTRAARASRRAALLRAVRRDRGSGKLPVYTTPHGPRSAATGIREIPIEAISGTLEPSRACQFDELFRPAKRSARARWEQIWIAEHRGAQLPPISVVPVGKAYAVRDGHHRVSVARARGAIAIDALVDAA